MSPAPALGSHLLLRPGSAGLGPEGLGRQEREWQGLPGPVHQESPGKEGGGERCSSVVSVVVIQLTNQPTIKQDRGENTTSSVEVIKHMFSCVESLFSFVSPQSNSKAALGKYVSSGAGGAAAQDSLFVADHAY